MISAALIEAMDETAEYAAHASITQTRPAQDLPQPTQPLAVEPGDLQGDHRAEWVIPALVIGAWVLIFAAYGPADGQCPDLSPIAALFGRIN